MSYLVKQGHQECVLVEIFIHGNSVPRLIATRRAMIPKLGCTVRYNANLDWTFPKKIVDISPRCTREVLPDHLIISLR
jgi:hypothetical protein